MAVLDGMDKLHWADIEYELPETFWVASEIQTASNGRGDKCEYVVQSWTSEKSAEDALQRVKMQAMRDVQPSRRYALSQYEKVKNDTVSKTN